MRSFSADVGCALRQRCHTASSELQEGNNSRAVLAGGELGVPDPAEDAPYHLVAPVQVRRGLQVGEVWLQDFLLILPVLSEQAIPPKMVHEPQAAPGDLLHPG